MNKYNIKDLIRYKQKNKKIAAITCYDFFSSKFVADADIPIVLVGDSASMVIYGYSTTIPISLNELILILRSVCRGNSTSIIVADMPFMSYQASCESAVLNAGNLIKKGGAHAVKLEGGKTIGPQISSILDVGIPVMGHLGLLPQSVNKLGGYKMHGKTTQEQKVLLEESLFLESLGVFAIVLECVSPSIAQQISSKLSIPIIGIGSGLYCDGQIQVLHDLLGIGHGNYPKHSVQYEKIGERTYNALCKYKKDVESEDFST